MTISTATPRQPSSVGRWPASRFCDGEAPVMVSSPSGGYQPGVELLEPPPHGVAAVMLVDMPASRGCQVGRQRRIGKQAADARRQPRRIPGRDKHAKLTAAEQV